MFEMTSLVFWINFGTMWDKSFSNLQPSFTWSIMKSSATTIIFQIYIGSCHIKKWSSEYKHVNKRNLKKYTTPIHHKHNISSLDLIQKAEKVIKHDIQWKHDEVSLLKNFWPCQKHLLIFCFFSSSNFNYLTIGHGNIFLNEGNITNKKQTQTKE